MDTSSRTDRAKCRLPHSLYLLFLWSIFYGKAYIQNKKKSFVLVLYWVIPPKLKVSRYLIGNSYKLSCMTKSAVCNSLWTIALDPYLETVTNRQSRNQCLICKPIVIEAHELIASLSSCQLQHAHQLIGNGNEPNIKLRRYPSHASHYPLELIEYQLSPAFC